MLYLDSLSREIERRHTTASMGKVVGVRGAIVLARLPQAALGDWCEIELRSRTRIRAQVVSFQHDIVGLAPLEEIQGLAPGAPVHHSPASSALQIALDMRGAVLDAVARPLLPHAANSPTDSVSLPIDAAAPEPLSRTPIRTQLVTGVRALDALCSVGYGQRIGLLAGPGIGKSTLLGMIARNAEVDRCVIALVGERGREVNEFIEHSLGARGMERSTVVVATSDQTPLKRATAVKTATAIAEHYRAKGERVLLLVDSLTRAARAIREVTLAAGELPIRQGFTASVFSELPKLLERSGTDAHGSITAIYTLLDAGDHEPDPLADEVKSLLDGHVSLSTRAALAGVRPAIDFDRSISRLMSTIRPASRCQEAACITRLLSRLARDRDILMFGGAPDRELQAALALEGELREFLSQLPEERASLPETDRLLQRLAGAAHGLLTDKPEGVSNESARHV